MANRSIEIHDARLAQLSVVSGTAELRFSALYIHESQGVPGVDAGIGWFQPAILRIYVANVAGTFASFPVDLTDGHMIFDGKRIDNVIALPLHFPGKFELSLVPMWNSDQIFSVTGIGADLELVGVAGDIEQVNGN